MFNQTQRTMKKILLLAVTIGLGLAVSAQSVYKKPPFAVEDAVGTPNKVVNPPLSNTQKNSNPAPLAVTVCDTTGYAGNAYGAYTRPGRSQLFCDPNLGAIIYTHRSSPARDATANTGHIMYDRSMDGGLTWTTTHQGPVYTPGADLGRYPQGIIYNPGNLTLPNLCYTAVYGPTVAGTTWTAHFNAAQPLMGGA